LSLAGQEPKQLADAIKKLEEQLAAASDPKEINRLNSIKKILSSIQSEGEAKLRQLPPTERGLASLAKAAALKREKRIVEDKGRPSGHFTRLDPNRDPDAMSPADEVMVRARRAARAAEAEKYPRQSGRRIQELPPVKPEKKLGLKETQAIRAAAKQMGLKKGTPTGGSLTEGGPLISARELLRKGMTNPEVAKLPASQKESLEAYVLRRMAEKRAYQESLAGSMDRPSAIENLQPDAFREFRKKATQIVSKLGDQTTKQSAKDVRTFNKEVAQAAKEKVISKEQANTLRNRLTEQLMTSGMGDPVLGALSGILGGRKWYQTKRGALKKILPNAAGTP
jgi:hypothetical protein